MLWKVPVASSVMLWWTLFISQLYCLTVMPWVSWNHLDWRVWQVPPSPKLVRFVRVSVVIVGRGHCLKATKTSVLTEPRRKELVNTWLITGARKYQRPKPWWVEGSTKLFSGGQKPCQVLLVYNLKDRSIVFLGLMSCSVCSSLLQGVSDQCGSHTLIILFTPSLHSQGQCINPWVEWCL